MIKKINIVETKMAGILKVAEGRSKGTFIGGLWDRPF